MKSGQAFTLAYEIYSTILENSLEVDQILSYIQEGGRLFYRSALKHEGDIVHSSVDYSIVAWFGNFDDQKCLNSVFGFIKDIGNDLDHFNAWTKAEGLPNSKITIGLSYGSLIYDKNSSLGDSVVKAFDFAKAAKMNDGFLGMSREIGTAMQKLDDHSDSRSIFGKQILESEDKNIILIR